MGLVVLVNGAPTQAHTALRNTLLDRLLGLEPKDWNALLKESLDRALAEGKEKERQRAEKRRTDTQPSREIAAYAGEYSDAAYGPAQVETIRDGLALSWSRFKLPLQHWHYDTFDLPDGATLLATNPCCAHQAFTVAEGVYGLQFHLEVTEAIVRGWLASFAGKAPPFAADAERQIGAYLAAATDFTAEVGRRWMDMVAARAGRKALAAA